MENLQTEGHGGKIQTSHDESLVGNNKPLKMKDTAMVEQTTTKSEIFEAKSVSIYLCTCVY